MNEQNNDLIPLKLLSEKQLELIDGLLIEFYKAGSFLEVSEDRTKIIIDKAEKAGFNGSEAETLARHFNAATKIVQDMPAQEKDKFQQALKARIDGPKT